MKQDVFNYTFSEWRRQEMRFFEMLTGGAIYSCPACEEEPHAVHIDWNMKLYRYKRMSKIDKYVSYICGSITNHAYDDFQGCVKLVITLVSYFNLSIVIIR